MIPVTNILADAKLLPNAGGVYGWWFDAGLPGEDRIEALSHGGYRLRYIGIAPRAPSNGRTSNSTLRKRIARNHLGNRLASSSLRRTLARLLEEKLRLKTTQQTVGVKTKMVMSPAEELRLTDWLRRHACLSIMIHEVGWELEAELLRSEHLPGLINKAGYTH